jgi:hypothetical protein
MKSLAVNELQNVSGGNYELTVEGIMLTGVGSVLAASAAGAVGLVSAGLSLGVAPFLFTAGAGIVGTAALATMTGGLYICESNPELANALEAKFGIDFSADK